MGCTGQGTTWSNKAKRAQRLVQLCLAGSGRRMFFSLGTKLYRLYQRAMLEVRPCRTISTENSKHASTVKGASLLSAALVARASLLTLP